MVTTDIEFSMIGRIRLRDERLGFIPVKEMNRFIYIGDSTLVVCLRDSVLIT